MIRRRGIILLCVGANLLVGCGDTLENTRKWLAKYDEIKILQERAEKEAEKWRAEASQWEDDVAVWQGKAEKWEEEATQWRDKYEQSEEDLQKYKDRYKSLYD